MKKIFIIFFSLSMVFVFSCKSSTFKSGTAVNYQDVMKTVNVSCKKDQLNVSIRKSMSGSHKTKTTVTGNICLNGKITKVKGEANILFIVDTSNSMANADPSGWLGNCDRKRAINEVISKITGGVSNSNVKGAVVTFGSSATASSWTNLSSLSLSGVCGHSGGTNYEDAFKKAESLFSGKDDGVNIVYFITDGAPSVSNSTSSYTNDWTAGQDAGKSAMDSLQSSVSNLTVNALYLVDPNLSTYGDGAPSESDTYDYLVDIVGSSSRVRKASSASELVDLVNTFDTTPAGTFASNKDIKATVTVNSKTTNVDVVKISHVSEGVYKFELEEVYLKGEYHETVDNIFKVVGTGSDGTTATSTVTIEFYQTSKG